MSVEHDSLIYSDVNRELRLSSEAELTETARTGSVGAFEELYRRHLPSARVTARYLLRNNSDADDVVADAFVGVLTALRNGGGPRDDNFRVYLLACVRNGCTMRGRQRGRSVPVDPTDFADQPGGLEDPQRFVDADAVATAYSSLPAPWQRVLWMTAVEDRPLDEVAEQMNLQKPAAAALSYRAHQALTEAYLAQTISSAHLTGPCAQIAPHLARYVRGRCRTGQRQKIRGHLTNCSSCSALADELTGVNHSLRGLMIPPVALGAFLLDRSKAHGAAAEAVTGAAAKTALATGTRFVVPGWLMSSKAAALIATAVVTFSPVLGGDPVNNPAVRAAGVVAETAVIDAELGPDTVTTGDIGEESVGGRADQADATATAGVVPAGGELVLGGELAVESGITDNSTLAVTVPANVPGSTGPPLSIPALTVPAVSVPAVSVPAVTVPAVTLPAVTVPALTVPALTIPPVTVPVIAVPAVTVPSLTFPVVTAPIAAAPVVTVAPVVPAPPSAPPVVVVPAAPGIDLGAARDFAVLGNAAVTSTGLSSITGHVGSSTGAITGLTQLQVLSGAIFDHDIRAMQAQTSAAAASIDITARPSVPLATVELGGKTISPGTYSSGTLAVTGTAVLDGGGDPNAIFVFKAATTLITASGSRVVTINGARPCNVFWQVGSSATFGTFSGFAGTVIADVSITATTGASFDGRLLAGSGAVTLDTNRVTVPSCG